MGRGSRIRRIRGPGERRLYCSDRGQGVHSAFKERSKGALFQSNTFFHNCVLVFCFLFSTRNRGTWLMQC